VESRLSLRERAARGLAILLVAWATSRIVVAMGLMLSGFAAVATDPATALLVERYSTLSEHVPGTGVTVGFVGPAEPMPGRQMLARYALAPLLLAEGDSHQLVLVDLDDDAALATFVAKAGAKVLAHPRPGLAILERPRGTP
jgi:hypothetical protein